MYAIRPHCFLRHTHTHSKPWCLCLCCHGDATCSLCLSNSSEKGESTTLPFPPPTLLCFTHLIFFSYPFLSLSFSVSFSHLPSPFLLLLGSSQEKPLETFLSSLSNHTGKKNIGISGIYIPYQLCTSLPALIMFHWGNRSIGHIIHSQQELNFPSSTSRWAEPVLMLWWDKSSGVRDEIWQMRKET